MPQIYDGRPEVSNEELAAGYLPPDEYVQGEGEDDYEPTSNELSTGWGPDEYIPDEADYEEMLNAQIESQVRQRDLNFKRRLREQLDRLIRIEEQFGDTESPF